MIHMILSKLTSKAQTTIPQSVRRALQLKPGDELEYQVIDGHVILTKAHGGQKTDDPFRTFDEWSSASDEKAYAKL
jgi:antitoxin PrlF